MFLNEEKLLELLTEAVRAGTIIAYKELGLVESKAVVDDTEKPKAKRKSRAKAKKVEEEVDELDELEEDSVDDELGELEDEEVDDVIEDYDTFIGLVRETLKAKIQGGNKDARQKASAFLKKKYKADSFADLDPKHFNTCIEGIKNV